jgi:hypothetical protein
LQLTMSEGLRHLIHFQQIVKESRTQLGNRRTATNVLKVYQILRRAITL